MNNDKTASTLCVAVFLTCVLIAGNSYADDAEAQPALDPLTGMKIAPGWEVVRNNCVSCHSAQQFLRQRGTAATWLEIIRWMQDAGGLWPLTQETETMIVSYLSKNYGPSGHYRRAPIPARLMPENPYLSEVRRTIEKTRQQRPPPDKTGSEHAAGDQAGDRKQQ